MHAGLDFGGEQRTVLEAHQGTIVLTEGMLGFQVQVPAFSGWDWLLGADVNYVDDYLAALTANPAAANRTNLYIM